MPFCTIVEWDTNLKGQLDALHDQPGGSESPPAGAIVRILGFSDSGSYAIELWDSAEAAGRFAEESAPALAQSELPPPTRVTGFETSSVFVR